MSTFLKLLVSCLAGLLFAALAVFIVLPRDAAQVAPTLFYALGVFDFLLISAVTYYVLAEIYPPTPPPSEP